MLSLNFSPPIIAHRGASAYAPENTIVAFNKAAELGIKWIEFDVMQAACGEPIIFHDEMLDRTTNAKGDPGVFPYSVLAELDAGSWFDSKFAGERVPTLNQVLNFLHETNMSANVEIKAQPGTEESLIKRVLADFAKNPPFAKGRILFSSFSITALRLLRKHSPHGLLGLLLDTWEADWESICLELDCISVHVDDDIITSEHAKKIKNMDKYLLCYTVNQPTRALELFSWGVDAVFSDVPDKILASLR